MVVGFVGMIWVLFVVRRMRQLVSEKKNLTALLEKFHRHDLDVQKTMKSLEKRTQDLYKNWEEALEKGEELKKDLAYFFDRSEALLNKMEPYLKQDRRDEVKQSLEGCIAFFDEKSFFLNDFFVCSPLFRCALALCFWAGRASELFAHIA